MNGATAWNPAPARAGSRCRHVWAVSGNPCRHSASGPDPASSSPNSSPFARTVADRSGEQVAIRQKLEPHGLDGRGTNRSDVTIRAYGARTQRTMALDQSALLEILDAFKAAEGDDRIRQAAETIYQALIEAELASVIGALP